MQATKQRSQAVYDRRYHGLSVARLGHSRQRDRTRGGKQVLNQVKQLGKGVSRLHTLWADGGFEGEPFMRWVMDVCRWIVQVVRRLEQTKGFVTTYYPSHPY